MADKTDDELNESIENYSFERRIDVKERREARKDRRKNPHGYQREGEELYGAGDNMRERRSSKERRYGVDRRLFTKLQRRHAMVQRHKEEQIEARKQRKGEPIPKRVAPTIKKQELTSENGEILAYHFRAFDLDKTGQLPNVIELAQQDSLSATHVYCDKPDNMVGIVHEGEEHTLEIEDSLLETLHIVATKNVTVHLNANSFGRTKIGSTKFIKAQNDDLVLPYEPSQRAILLTIMVEGLHDNMQHLGGNTFRFGTAVVVIDQQMIVNVVDESGREFRISGPKGPDNLERYLMGV